MLGRLNPRLGHEEIGYSIFQVAERFPNPLKKGYKVPSVDALFVRKIALYFGPILDQEPNVLNHSATRTR